VRRTFSRSAALSWALYWAWRMVLRTLPQRSGSQEAVNGASASELYTLGLPVVPPPAVPVAPTLFSGLRRIGNGGKKEQSTERDKVARGPG